MEKTAFEELIRQFGARVGLPEMKLDEVGLCRVVLDETVNLDFELSSDGQMLYIYSALPPIDQEIATELMKALISANYALHRSCNCRFAFDENANEFLLLETISGNQMDLETFDQILQNFARTATTWHTNCRRREFSGGGNVTESSSGEMHLPFV